MDNNYSKLIRAVLNDRILSESVLGVNTAYFQNFLIPAFIVENSHNIGDKSHNVIVNVGLKL